MAARMHVSLLLCAAVLPSAVSFVGTPFAVQHAALRARGGATCTVRKSFCFCKPCLKSTGIRSVQRDEEALQSLAKASLQCCLGL